LRKTKDGDTDGGMWSDKCHKVWIGFPRDTEKEHIITLRRKMEKSSQKVRLYTNKS
jgi:hypothetical protein